MTDHLYDPKLIIELSDPFTDPSTWIQHVATLTIKHTDGHYSVRSRCGVSVDRPYSSDRAAVPCGKCGLELKS